MCRERSIMPGDAAVAAGQLDHVNVRSMIDGKKMRISAARKPTDTHGTTDLGSMTVSAIHRRLAHDAGYDAHGFALHLGGPKSAPISAFSSSSVGRVLRAEEYLRDIAYWSRATNRMTVLLEVRPWASMAEPPSLGSDPPSASASVASRSASRNSAIEYNRTGRREVHTADRDDQQYQEMEREEELLRASRPGGVTATATSMLQSNLVPSSRRAASKDEVPPVSSTPSIGDEHVLETLQYQYDIAEALLNEDRQLWANELVALESRLANESHRRAPDDDKEMLQAELDLSKLRDEYYALQKKLEAKKRTGRGELDKRDVKRREVDRLASEIELGKKRILDQMAKCGAAEAKDLEVVDRLVELVCQLHLYTVEADISASEAARIGAALENAKYQRRVLHNSVEQVKGNIRVVVRLRPLLPIDLAAPYHPVRDEEGALLVNETENTVRIASPATGTHDFEFYKVYGPPSDDSKSAQDEQQRRIFLEQVQPLLQSLFDGHNICVMAYGQTGSGKTHTIFGESAAVSDAPNGVQRWGNLNGLLPQALDQVFVLREEYLEANHHAVSADVTLSMVEVYMNDVFDLLASAEPDPPGWALSTGRSGSSSGPRTVLPKCDVKAVNSVGATVVGATEINIKSAAAALEAVERGFANRTTHTTLTNTRSSRSHLLLTLQLVLTRKKTSVMEIEKPTLMFVDLAGSERVHRSLSSGDRLKEAQHINKSLSALGDVLAALTQRTKGHVPYRNSRLTHLLQRCVGGNCRTLLMACICPHVPQRHNLGETASTLTFASRARLVRNKISDDRLETAITSVL